jgi:hypothetical protein
MEPDWAQVEPKNTIVVMSKPAPTSGTALLLLFTCIGLLIGLFVHSAIGESSSQTPTDTSSPKNAASAMSNNADPPPTQVIVVHAVLELPTATATTTPIATVQATLPPDVNFCTKATPTALCKVPYPPPPTPTPYPSCLDENLYPGDWCQWPAQETATPAPTARAEVWVIVFQSVFP